jgi:hypothetical protein
VPRCFLFWINFFIFDIVLVILIPTSTCYQQINTAVLCFFLESERAERERKGDLDRYERLGGDRNQTTECLAVKKVCNLILLTWRDGRICLKLSLTTYNVRLMEIRV